MATKHPTLAVQKKLESLALQGVESAQHLLELLDVCTDVLDSTNGIEQVFGLVGDSPDEICAAHIDDALTELFPVILKVVDGGWQSLKFYASPDRPFPTEWEQANSSLEEKGDENG